MTTPIRTLRWAAISASALAAAFLISEVPAQDKDTEGPSGSAATEQLPTPARGYLEAHREVMRPRPLLGGPVRVTIGQDMGGVFVAVPGERPLDEAVFGTPERPLAIGGFPMVEGVPVPLRTTEGDAFGATTEPTPFGDEFIAMGNGKLRLEMIDATAADAMTSEDSVNLEAS